MRTIRLRFGFRRSLWHRLIAALLFSVILTRSRPGRADEGAVARVVNGLASVLYRYAWPTATYESVRCCQFDRTESGDYVASFRLNGRSRFDNGPLWTEVRIVVDKNLHIVDMGYGKNNAILAQPGETMGALRAVLADLNARAQEQRGSPPAPVPYPAPAPPPYAAPPPEQSYPPPPEPSYPPPPEPSYPPPPEPPPEPSYPPPPEPPPEQSYPPPPEQSYAPDAESESSSLATFVDVERLHDGFYLRMSIGFGSLGASFDDQHSSQKKIAGLGEAGGAELRIGGSPVPGFVVGVGVIAQTGTATLERPGFPKTDRDLYLIITGPMIDIYPSPRKGFHVGALLGVSAAGPIDSKSKLETDSAGFLRQTWGVGAALTVGYDFWVAKQWALGPSLQLSGALSEGDKKDQRALDAQTGTALVMFTAVYH